MCFLLAAFAAGATGAVAASQHGVRRAQSGVWPASVACQIKDQRRGHARAVLRGLARTYQGRPATGVATILHQALGPLGVRTGSSVSCTGSTRAKASRRQRAMPPSFNDP